LSWVNVSLCNSLTHLTGETLLIDWWQMARGKKFFSFRQILNHLSSHW